MGSVFYAFPAVAAVASIFSPLALLIACIILAIYRPILLELGSAIRLNGANYIYLLQCSGKTLGAIGAAATLLDAVATSVVSAATAGAYLKGEIPNLSIQEWGIGMCLLVGIALIALISIRESSSLTLSITLIHVRITHKLVNSWNSHSHIMADDSNDNPYDRVRSSMGQGRNGCPAQQLGIAS